MLNDVAEQLYLRAQSNDLLHRAQDRSEFRRLGVSGTEVYVRLLALSARTVLASSVASGRSTFGGTLPRSSTAAGSPANRSISLSVTSSPRWTFPTLDALGRPGGGEECVDLGWFTPDGALDAHRSDEIALVFPTIKHLEQLREFPSARALLAYASGRDVQPVQPRVILEGEVARIVLPGEPGY